MTVLVLVFTAFNQLIRLGPTVKKLFYGVCQGLAAWILDFYDEEAYVLRMIIND